MKTDTIAGSAVFFDGKTSARHDVTVELAPELLRIRTANGNIEAEWAYDELETLAAPADVLRVGRRTSPVLARLEIRDPVLAAAVDERSTPVDRSGRTEGRLRRRIIFWTLAASASLLLVAVVVLPEIATRLAPLVPYPLERKLGETIDAQVRASLDTGSLGPGFQCGNREGEAAGRLAFTELIGRLERAAHLPLPLNAAVVRRPEANAVALPGGRIYVFAGLIDRAETPDELAGVIAHEIGHVAHRDGVRSVLQGAGLSLLFGMLLGDFFGGGAIVLAATSILQTSYSREVEAAADLYAVALMTAAGGDARALGTILQRIAGANHPGMKILLDHPETRDRVIKINAAASSNPVQPLLDRPAWAALKRVCSGR